MADEIKMVVLSKKKIIKLLQKVERKVLQTRNEINEVIKSMDTDKLNSNGTRKFSNNTCKKFSRKFRR